MDDFLGTSIQYSELQIKLLEKEHYENQQKIVEELINSGFLDSDYEEDSTETESTDNELSEASLEIQENNLNESESPLIESIDDSKMDISPRNSSASIIDDKEEKEEEEEDNNNNNNNLNMVLSSDISEVDELTVSNSESINGASINHQIIRNNQYREYREYSDNNMDNEQKAQISEHENEYDSDDQIQAIQQFDVVTSKAILRFMEFVFSDIKYLMILFVLMVAMPNIIERAHNDNDNDMQQFCGGGVRYQYGGGYHRGHDGYHHETSISWTVAPYHATTTHSIINDEDDERDEYENGDDDDLDENDEQCAKKQHILSFDIITSTLNTHTRKLCGARISHHEFKISPSDLCNHGLCNHGPNYMRKRMRIRNMGIPGEMPRLFINIGGLSSMRIFKETSIASVGRHFGSSHGLYALVMAFVGIAGYAASNNIDEIMSISISS